jgi:glycosyltransferase involved in cell wall biosynthesis
MMPASSKPLSKSNFQVKTPKNTLTVLVLTYNQENILERSLDSIFAQETNIPFFVHVINDASTDNTVNVIRKYARKYPKTFSSTTYVTNQYQNGFAPEFPLISKVDTSHIAFCDGDDFWISKDKIALQMQEFERDPSLAIVHTGYFLGYTNDDGMRLIARNPKSIRKAINCKNPKDFIYGNETKKSTVMIRKSALNLDFLLGCFKVRAQDWIICANASCNGGIRYLEKETTVYTISKSAAFQSLSNQEKLAVKSEVRWFCASRLPDTQTRELYRHFLLREMMRNKFNTSIIYRLIRPLVMLVRKYFKLNR